VVLKDALQQQATECLEALRRGELTEAALQRLVDALDASDGKRQNLLYVQAGSTSPGAGIHGMLIVRDGELIEPDPDDLPYRTVLDAIRDGWRIIAFPNLALLMDESRTTGLGCEFVLEKWG
jgi:hypothetical protein